MATKKTSCVAIYCPFCKRMFYMFGFVALAVNIYSCAWCNEIIIEDHEKEYLERANKALTDGSLENGINA